MSLPDWSDDNLQSVAPLIDQWAAQYGIPHDVAFGLVSQESRFNPNATGAAGEIGLTQIKPSTASGLGFTGTADQLYDPGVNLAFGLQYLAQQIARYNGDIASALSAYNAGHMITGNAAYVNGVLARAAYFASLWAAQGDGQGDGGAGAGVTAAGVVGALALAYGAYRLLGGNL